MRLTDVLKEARKWKRDLSIEDAFAHCDRGHWLLWIHGKLYPDFATYPNQVRKRILVAGLTANLVRHLMIDERSIAAVDSAIAFGKGQIGLDELNEAAKNAKAAAHATFTPHGAAYAAVYATNPEIAYAAAITTQDANAESANIFRAHISLDEMLQKCRQSHLF